MNSTSSVDAWSLVQEIGCRLDTNGYGLCGSNVVDSNMQLENINVTQRRETINYLHNITAELANHLPHVMISVRDKSTDISTTRLRKKFIDTQLAEICKQQMNLEITSDGIRFVAVLTLYCQIIKSLAGQSTPVCFDQNIQLSIRTLPSFQNRDFFVFVDNETINNIICPDQPFDNLPASGPMV